MKIIVASDIHGSLTFCRELIAAYEREGAEKLLLLGDILYHGPRNGLCEGYDPKGVADTLNLMREDILSIRGNCDSEVDQMVLDFPMMSEFCLLYNCGTAAICVHGHKDMDKLALGGIRIVFSGHTHVPTNTIKDGVLWANPGSVSIPKEDTPRGYILWEGDALTWKTLTGEIYDTRIL